VHHDANIERFYTTTAWRKCRASFLKEKNGLCEICLAKGLIEPAVHVHHKVHLTPKNLDNPAITLSHDNLMALCEECHQEQHRTRRWRCDPNGHVRL
jgi:5-methylcytosine-specific restriction endonuclease McrA